MPVKDGDKDVIMKVAIQIRLTAYYYYYYYWREGDAGSKLGRWIHASSVKLFGQALGVSFSY